MTARAALISEALRLEGNAKALDPAWGENQPDIKRWRARATLLRKAAADMDEAARCLAWALDLLDIYDEGAIREGHCETIVLTEQHIEAKLRSRAVLAALSNAEPPQ
ncbi:hypothetical protein [Phenylobacterium sp. J367]|nr:hypothetical protein [Phenylobacterium sp. J367]MCR5876979.1 hypothetical protein [Phenylobacterium sp. J367]